MKLLILDNYDSFTYNIVHAVRAAGFDPVVARNDKITIPEIGEFDKIIISPGPGIPSEAGILMDMLKSYAGQKPILGVCLGHQAIGEYFGGQLENLSEVYHGVQTPAHITAQDYIFDGVSEEFMAGRYHSWIVSDVGLPSCLTVTSRDDEDRIMSLKHRDFDIHGVQFHPESVMTPGGERIILNFINHKN